MSIADEMSRISTALDAVESGKTAIAEAITAKGVGTLPDSGFDTLAANIGLIEGGGASGGNLQRTFLGSVTLDGTVNSYRLQKPLNTNGLMQVDFVIKFPVALTTNAATYFGFSVTDTHNSAEEQMFSLGGRSGSDVGLCNWIPPVAPNATVGYWIISSPSAYSMQAGPSYSRNPANGSIYLNSHNENDALNGAVMEVYAINKL